VRRAIQIHGAGIAGLSVAAAVRKLCPTSAIQFIDPKPSDGSHKSLAFFDTGRAGLAALARVFFKQASVYAPTGAHIGLDLSQFPYCVTRGVDVIAYLRSQAGFEGASSEALAGDAPLIVDARPSNAKPFMWQVFFGGEFELVEAFDDKELVLMDFRVHQNVGVRFIYIVPLSPHRVLIQDTYFCTHSMLANPDPHRIARHMLLHYGVRIRSQLASENGAIPMGLPRTPSDLDRNAICVGAKAGWIRAATGYSLLDSQRGAENFARWYASGADDLPNVRARPRLSDWMDTLFLAALARAPEQGCDWLSMMFVRAPTPAVVRFLSGCGSAIDHLMIAKALACRGFLSALFHSTKLGQ
jgi:hypothetical protein